jgi:hypothetical protein
MKKYRLFMLVAAFLISGCVIGFDRRGNMVIVPALPTVVEIDADDYYYQDGYYYSYRGNVWFYGESRRGPWVRLPRNRYPREVHIRHHNDYRDHHEHDHR